MVVGLVGVAMLAIALIGFVVEGVMLWMRRRAQRSGQGFLLGPLVYAVAGAVLVAVVEAGSLEAREVLDQWSWVVVVLALVPWIAAHWRRQG